MKLLFAKRESETPLVGHHRRQNNCTSRLLHSTFGLVYQPGLEQLRTLPPTALKVAVFLLCAQGAARARVPQEVIARHCGVHVKSVSRAIRHLRDCEWFDQGEDGLPYAVLPAQEGGRAGYRLLTGASAHRMIHGTRANRRTVKRFFTTGLKGRATYKVTLTRGQGRFAKVALAEVQSQAFARMTRAAVLGWLALKLHGNNRNEAVYPSQATLGRLMGAVESTAHYAVRQLRRLGVVLVEQPLWAMKLAARWQTNSYWFVPLFPDAIPLGAVR